MSIFRNLMSFRELSPEELGVVAGGDGEIGSEVTCTAGYRYHAIEFPSFADGGGGGGGGFGGGGFGGGGGGGEFHIPDPVVPFDDTVTANGQEYHPGDIVVTAPLNHDQVVIINTIANQQTSNIIGSAAFLTGFVGLDAAAALEAAGLNGRIAAGITAATVATTDAPTSAADIIKDSREAISQALFDQLSIEMQAHPDEFFNWRINPLDGKAFDANGPGYNDRL